MDSPEAVKAVELVKSYDGHPAVNGLTFSVPQGSFFGILGPNGAGKTTTVRMVYGYAPPTAGSLSVLGMDVKTRRREVAAKVGVCQQDNNLDPDLSVRENLLVFARYFDIPKHKAASRADELLEFIALDGRRDSKVTELSGGMMRRLVLARALLNNPSLLILDEPTTGLDPQSRHQLWDKLRELKSGGITVLLTTHYMDEAERLCDDLMIVDQGKLLVRGAPSELITRYAGRQVIEVTEPTDRLRGYLTEKKIPSDDLGHRAIIYSNDPDAPFHEIIDSHCAGSCSLRNATLEDVFLRLTGRGLRE